MEQVHKHVCKLCNKRYPSGKSLGGHMRSHVIANAHKSKKALSFVKHQVDDDHDHHDGDDVDHDNEINGNEGKSSGYGYGLRENPKKTWRLVNISGRKHTFHVQQQRVCKQCGKGFDSLKALCGHMSSHSEKERNFKQQHDDDDDGDDGDGDSWSSDNKKELILAVESHCDNNKSNWNSKRQTRSCLLKYRSVSAVDSISPPTGGDSGGGNGGGSSSNHSEIDQHEQEEVAMCLMMLSRDYSSGSGHKTCFNFAAESSDNNSVILEGGSSSNYVGKRKDHLISDKKEVKQVIGVANEEVNNNNNNQEINNSDSGYFENGARGLESDGSVDGFARNYGVKKSKIEFGSRLVGDSKKRKIKDTGSFNFDSPESDENCSKKIKHQDYNSRKNNTIKKGSKYECWKCNKTFKTHQALGGHIISHRKTGDSSLDSSISANKQLQTCSDSKNLVVATTKSMPCSKLKKVKGHKCPYCPRVFKSGQALGGHKRSHMIGGGTSGVVNLHVEAENSRFKRERTPPPPPPPELEPEPEPQHHQPPLIDLNLPAPTDEEDGENSQFVAW